MARIAFLIPTLSRGCCNIEDTHLFKITLPSIKQTCKSYTWKIFLGVDDDDAVYTSNMSKLTEFDTTIFESLQYKGYLTKIWNVLAKKAFDYGYDYFVQCGDDIVFHDGWLERGIDIMRSHDDVCMTGVYDIKNLKLMSQTMVSRKHIDTFGFYFPEEIRNWYCDDWINEVYRYCDRGFVCGSCENTGGKERYDIYKIDHELLKTLVSRDSSKLASKYSIQQRVSIGLVITTFNRHSYLYQTFASLVASELNKGTFDYEIHVVIVDDSSTDENIRSTISEFSLSNVRSLHKIFKETNKGVFDSLRVGWNYLVSEKGCTILMNIDSDVLVDRYFVSKSINLYTKYRPKLFTGYNSCMHNTVKTFDDICMKQSCGGINLMFSSVTYVNTIRYLLTTLVFDWIASNIFTGDIVCAIPSIVQHIGINGIHNNTKSIDISVDF